MKNDILKLGEKFNFNETFDNKLLLQYIKNFETFIKKHKNKADIPKIRSSFLNTIKNSYNRELANNSYENKK